MLSYSWLAPLNGTLNSIAAALLLAGFVFIRRGQVRAHRACMIAAFSVSVIFLVSYLIYHYQVGDVRFRPGMGPPGVLHDADFPYRAGGGDRATGDNHAGARAARALRCSSPNCALDLADLDLRIGHRRARLRNGVPDIRPATTALKSQ